MANCSTERTITHIPACGTAELCATHTHKTDRHGKFEWTLCWRRAPWTRIKSKTPLPLQVRVYPVLGTLGVCLCSICSECFSISKAHVRPTRIRIHSHTHIHETLAWTSGYRMLFTPSFRTTGIKCECATAAAGVAVAGAYACTCDMLSDSSRKRRCRNSNTQQCVPHSAHTKDHMENGGSKFNNM